MQGGRQRRIQRCRQFLQHRSFVYNDSLIFRQHPPKLGQPDSEFRPISQRRVAVDVMIELLVELFLFLGENRVGRVVLIHARISAILNNLSDELEKYLQNKYQFDLFYLDSFCDFLLPSSFKLFKFVSELLFSNVYQIIEMFLSCSFPV